jgi:hypothetical protein
MIGLFQMTEVLPEKKYASTTGIRLLLLPLTLYVVLVTLTASVTREILITDTVSYIGIARLVSEGQFAESVSGYWSPLFSWSMAPLLVLKIDPLYAAHSALAIWGGLLIIAGHVFLQACRPLHWLVHTAALCLIAVSAIGWATCTVTPDVILAGCLTFYFAAVSSAKICEQNRLAILAGCLGGLSYLAKSYALPFFLIHFTVTLLMRAKSSPEPISTRQLARTWIKGVMGFLLIAGPWIGVLSWKYQQFTFSKAASIAHAIIGPDDMRRSHPMDELSTPADGRIDIWETPELMHYNHWSPLHSPSYFVHQARFTVLSTVWVLNDIGNYDAFFFSVVALILAPILLFKRSAARDSFWILWTPVTVALYTGGFMLVYNTPRYLEAVLWPLICVYVLRLASQEFVIPKRRRLLLTVLVFVSFFIAATSILYLQIRHAEMEHHGRFRAIAGHLSEQHREGSFAASHDRLAAMFIAFHANLTCCGIPAETKVAEIDAALRRHAVRTFLIQPEWTLADDFRASTSWQLQDQFEYDNSTYYVYGPRAE